MQRILTACLRWSMKPVGRRAPPAHRETRGPKGDPGVGIKTITGSIDGSNKLTLTITLTDETTQTVEGTLTPPAAG